MSDSRGVEERDGTGRKCQHCFRRQIETQADRWAREDWPAYIQLSVRTHLAPAELICQTGERTRGSLRTVTHVQLWPGPTLSSFNEQHATTEGTRTRERLSSHALWLLWPWMISKSEDCLTSTHNYNCIGFHLHLTEHIVALFIFFV